MSKKAAFYIYSTLTAAMKYTNHRPGGADLPEVDGDGVYVAGGANIPDKYMVAPNGAVITPITADELEYLRANETFNLHEKNGFIVVKDKKEDPEKTAGDMQGRDKSAPLVDQDFEAEGQNAPVVNSETNLDGTPKKPSNSRRA